MSAKNGYAALVKQRTEGKTKRRRLDDYETPGQVTRRLLRYVKFRGPILEPASGSGRMAHALRVTTGLKVTGFDIKRGNDFLKRTAVWPGDTVTNPPYRDGLAERFVQHALKITDGRVAMLMQSGFLWGGRRGLGLFADCPPDFVIVLPERIYFLAGGKPIPSQFFSHAWLSWPPRKVRDARTAYTTKLIWAEPEDDFR